MKIKKFDVVELKNKNKAVILEIYKRKRYYAEIVNDKGETINKKESEFLPGPLTWPAQLAGPAHQ